MYFTVFLKAAELVEVTQDQSWSDPTWTAKEESIPALLKELTVSSAICLHIILRKKSELFKSKCFFTYLHYCFTLRCPNIYDLHRHKLLI